MENFTSFIVILLSLKLLKADQNAIINQISTEKFIALIGNSNQKETKQKIAEKSYIHIFTCLGITLIKKFKANNFDHFPIAQ